MPKKDSTGECQREYEKFWPFWSRYMGLSQLISTKITEQPANPGSLKNLSDSPWQFLIRSSVFIMQFSHSVCSCKNYLIRLCTINWRQTLISLFSVFTVTCSTKKHTFMQYIILKQETTANLIAIVHQIVHWNKSFEHNHPVGILSTLNQKVGHLWHWYIRLIGALQQVWQKIQHTAQQTKCPVHINLNFK